MGALTSRQRVALAALASVPGAHFAPVQVQKMFFLLDENIANDFGGKQFNFEPYDYGPFDKAVYQELDFLKSIGLVDIAYVSPGAGGRRYFLTDEGQEFGAAILADLPGGAEAFMREVAEWVRRLSFAQLVGSIYKAFPHMRARSIFVE